VNRFNFPLERVRRWRSEQASVEEQKLGQLRAELVRHESARRGLEDEVTQAEIRVLSQPSIDALELTSLGSYRVLLRRKTREMEKRRREYEMKIAEQLKRVLEARRQAELLDRLRRKGLDQWRAAADKEQEELASELFLGRPTRNA